MRVCIKGARREAIIFATIFAIVWMRLIDLKSEIDSTPSFLGSSTIFDEFTIGIV